MIKLKDQKIEIIKNRKMDKNYYYSIDYKLNGQVVKRLKILEYSILKIFNIEWHLTKFKEWIQEIINYKNNHKDQKEFLGEMNQKISSNLK